MINKISDEFRIKSSILIEHYQYIESYLESIYANVSQKGFFAGLDYVSKHNLTQLIKELREIDLAQSSPVLKASDYDKLWEICKRRNFWVHEAYYELAFNANTGDLKKQCSTVMMNKDLAEAESMRDYLFEKQLKSMEENRESIHAEIKESLEHASETVKDVIVDIKHYS